MTAYEQYMKQQQLELTIKAIESSFSCTGDWKRSCKECTIGKQTHGVLSTCSILTCLKSEDAPMNRYKWEVEL